MTEHSPISEPNDTDRMDARPLGRVDPVAFARVWSRRDISLSRVARALGVTRQAVSHKARTMGLPPRTGNHDPQKRCSDDLFRRMWLAGVSLSDMAQHLGYSRVSAVRNRRVAMGLPARTRSTGGKGGAWSETISLAAFLEGELAARMREAAKEMSR